MEKDNSIFVIGEGVTDPKKIFKQLRAYRKNLEKKELLKHQFLKMDLWDFVLAALYQV